MNRTDPVALKKAGNTAFGKGRYTDALELYTAAIDLWMEPADRAVLYSNRSAARMKLPGGPAERQKALADAKRACELDPTYAKAHYRRGLALRAIGEPKAAIEAMERVLELAPGDGAAKVELEELKGGVTAPIKPQLVGSLQPGQVHIPSASRVRPLHSPPHARTQQLPAWGSSPVGAHLSTLRLLPTS
jgi:tetratricopeptide (TPR) repeat protein